VSRSEKPRRFASPSPRRMAASTSPAKNSNRGIRSPPQLTPSLRCKLVDEVVYWNTSFLSG
jgi:hypothetical protein